MLFSAAIEFKVFFRVNNRKGKSNGTEKVSKSDNLDELFNILFILCIFLTFYSLTSPLFSLCLLSICQSYKWHLLLLEIGIDKKKGSDHATHENMTDWGKSILLQSKNWQEILRWNGYTLSRSFLKT